MPELELISMSQRIFIACIVVNDEKHGSNYQAISYTFFEQIRPERKRIRNNMSLPAMQQL